MPGSGVDGGVIKAGVIVISLPPLLLLDITSALITSPPGGWLFSNITSIEIRFNVVKTRGNTIDKSTNYRYIRYEVMIVVIDY